MNEQGKRTLLEEMVAYTTPPQVQAEDITIQEFAEAAGLGLSGAKGRLDAVVAEGKLVRLKAFDPVANRWKWVYRRPDG